MVTPLGFNSYLFSRLLLHVCVVGLAKNETRLPPKAREPLRLPRRQLRNNSITASLSLALLLADLGWRRTHATTWPASRDSAARRSNGSLDPIARRVALAECVAPLEIRRPAARAAAGIPFEPADRLDSTNSAGVWVCCHKRLAARRSALLCSDLRGSTRPASALWRLRRERGGRRRRRRAHGETIDRRAQTLAASRPN